MKISLLYQAPVRDAAARHLAESPEGSPLFPGGALESPAAVARRLAAAESWTGDHAALAVWLRTQNAFAPLHPAQTRNLEAAADARALFLLTGQQPGLLGGPALWYAKAMTCAAWARRLSQQLGRPVLPLFWVAGDDSDLAECNAVEWLEPHAPAAGTSLEFSDPRDPVPMSLRVLSDAAAASLQQHMRGVWKADTAALASGYRSGCSLTEAFLTLAQRLLGSEGVLFVDGLEAAARAQPLLRRLLAEAPGFQSAFRTGSRRLQEDTRLGLQVPERPGAVPAFMLRHGQRVRLFFTEVGGSVRVYAQGAESRDLAAQAGPLDLLHSALSRPLAAETVFPVLGHVLGPAELRYFAQLADVFPAFGFSPPALAPRQQIVLCPDAEWRRLEALDFRPRELPDLGPSRLRARLTERAWIGHRAAAEFPADAFDALSGSLRRYQESVLPGSGHLAAAGRRLERGFARYREAARQAVFQREAAAAHASFHPLLRWLGNGSQDRHLNLLSVYDALGATGFTAWAEHLRDPAGGLRVLTYADDDAPAHAGG